MRIPLAPAGLREMSVLTLLFAGPAAIFVWLGVTGSIWAWPLAVLFGVAWLGGLAFFRDPERVIPTDAVVMVSPADGKVTETTTLDSYPEIGGPALRIGLFLSVFDVHINRSPCAGTIRSVTYKPGKFLDARHCDCGALNEANTIVIEPDAPHSGPVVVRQVAGLIARRIVCDVKPGDHVTTGQRIGLIKFGSRTELILPGRDLYRPTVALGEHVNGARSILARRLEMVTAGISSKESDDAQASAR
jgi:phosphatidylserine decarboxylase